MFQALKTEKMTVSVYFQSISNQVTGKSKISPSIFLGKKSLAKRCWHIQHYKTKQPSSIHPISEKKNSNYNSKSNFWKSLGRDAHFKKKEFLSINLVTNNSFSPTFRSNLLCFCSSSQPSLLSLKYRIEMTITADKSSSHCSNNKYNDI